ncbi:MAG: hypothetical protein ABW184_16580 [Sphingobium sp.]
MRQTSRHDATDRAVARHHPSAPDRLPAEHRPPEARIDAAEFWRRLGL